ncbi:hypothetical protein TPENAI_61094 [Tenacibaculum litopenaei]
MREFLVSVYAMFFFKTLDGVSIFLGLMGWIGVVIFLFGMLKY